MAEPPQPTAEEKARYEALKKELIAAIPKKRALDKHLANIESQIYSIEGTYLTDTSVNTGGNIVVGFDGYLKHPSGAARRKHELSDHDRLFTASSLTHQKSLEIHAEESGEVLTPQPPPAEPPLTTQQKKLKRDAEYQRKRRAQARGRSTTVDSDDDPSASGGSSRRPPKRQKMEDD